MKPTGCMYMVLPVTKLVLPDDSHSVMRKIRVPVIGWPEFFFLNFTSHTLSIDEVLLKNEALKI